MTKGPWKRISAGAKDLVRKILVPNPEERLTINQIFGQFCLLFRCYSDNFILFSFNNQLLCVFSDHPWLREHCDSEGLQSPPIAIPVAEVVPALSATAITVRPVPLADLSARFRRSNSGESLASSNFSEFSPRGSRKWVLPSDNSSSFSGTYSGIMKNAAEAARKIHIPRGGSGELPPVYNLRSPHSGEFSSHRSLGDPGTFQVQKSADYAVAQRSPQQQQGSFLVKTSSLGTNRAPASSRIPKQSSGDLGLNLSKPRAFPLPTPSSSSGVRQRSPDHSALNSTNARDDARERLRSLSFGKLDANEAKKTEKLASRGNSPAFPAGDNLERRTSQDKPANDGKSDGNGRQGKLYSYENNLLSHSNFSVVFFISICICQLLQRRLGRFTVFSSFRRKRSLEQMMVLAQSIHLDWHSTAEKKDEIAQRRKAFFWHFSSMLNFLCKNFATCTIVYSFWIYHIINVCQLVAFTVGSSTLGAMNLDFLKL